MELEYDIEKFSRIGDPAMRAREFLAISPNSCVPLLLDGDVRISESPAIAEYLVARHGNGRLAPEVNSRASTEYLQWLHYGEGMDHGSHEQLRSRDHSSQAKTPIRGTCEACAQADDAHASDGRRPHERSRVPRRRFHACLMCERFGVDFSEMPYLKAYVDRLQERPALQKALAL